MMRQSSSRNQRSKGGFRLKHFLQICILLAICTWLIYQVKHSHDKKRAFEESITKITNKITDQNQPDLFNFGRKGLPLVKENDRGDMGSTLSSKNGDNEEGQEEEEEGEQEHDMKQEEVEDEEGKRDGDDAIDELDQDIGDEENEQEEEFSREDVKDGQAEEDDLFSNQENEESTQEAREEHYKRDDASSAVAHEMHMTESETGAADPRDLDEEHRVNPGIVHPGIEDADVKNMENRTVGDAKSIGYSTLGNVTSMNNLSSVAFSENMTVPNSDLAMNGSHSEAFGLGVDLSKPENSTISNLVPTEGSSHKFVQPNTTITTSPENNTQVAAIDAKTSPENNTEAVALHTAKASDRPENHSIPSDFVSMKEIPQDGSTISIPIQGQNTSLVSATSGEGVAEHHEKSGTSERHEAEDHPITSKMSENGSTTRAEPAHLPHNADTAADSEARSDLSTLPDIQNVAKHDGLHAAVMESSTH